MCTSQGFYHLAIVLGFKYIFEFFHVLLKWLSRKYLFISVPKEVKVVGEMLSSDSCKGSWFGSQHIHVAHVSYVTPVTGHPMFPSDLRHQVSHVAHRYT